MKEKYPLAYKYFLTYQEELVKRNMDNNYKTWYQFARSQGLSNCYKKKLVVNHIMANNQKTVEVYELPEDTFVYSGIYITAHNDEKLEFIKQELLTPEFAKYAILCGKDMSGGYKSFSTNTIKQYGVNGTKFDLIKDCSNENIQKLFLERISKSYEIYTNSSRSNEKLKPIHSFIAEVLQYKLGEDYVIKSEGFRNGKEEKIQGAYYDKDVDICVLKNKVPLGSVAVKFICSNYSQNSNNYFENMLGETANLRRNDGYYAQLIILPEFVPYFKEGKILDKVEDVKDRNLQKYLTLNNDSLNYPHRPDLLSTIIINFDNKDFLKDNIGKRIIPQDLANSVDIKYSDVSNSEHITSDNIRTFIIKHNNIAEFIDAVASYVKAKGYGI